MVSGGPKGGQNWDQVGVWERRARDPPGGPRDPPGGPRASFHNTQVFGENPRFGRKPESRVFRVFSVFSREKRLQKTRKKRGRSNRTLPFLGILPVFAP